MVLNRYNSICHLTLKQSTLTWIMPPPRKSQLLKWKKKAILLYSGKFQTLKIFGRDFYVIVKILVLSLFLLSALRKFYVKKGGFSITTYLLGLQIACLIGLLIFDLTTRNIFICFFLMHTSNFVTYTALLHVIRSVELPQRQELT